MTDQQLDNRAWLIEHRRWVRNVERMHANRMMAGAWRWLYAK